jgi:hypothetical protein
MNFERDGYKFSIDRLNAFGQLHLTRKLAPLMPTFAPVLHKYMGMRKGELLGANLLEVAELAGPFCEALASMKNEDAEQVVTIALSSVKVQTDARSNTWMPYITPGTNRMCMIELDDLGRMLPVVIKVISFNLGNFMAALLTRHGEANQESSGEPSRMGKTG